MELLKIIVDISTCIGIIIAALEFHFMRKTSIAEHERIQKQATFEYFSSICEQLYSLNHQIYVKYKRQSINYMEVQDDDEFISILKQYLNMMETIAAGINTGIYNIYVFDRLYGDVALRVSVQLEDYINNRRNLIGEQEIYKDYDELMNHLVEIHQKRKNILNEKAVITNKIYK